MYRRMEELDPRVVVKTVQELRAKGVLKITRNKISRKLGSLQQGDKIDQQVARTLIHNPHLLSLCEIIEVPAVNNVLRSWHIMPLGQTPLLDELAEIVRQRKEPQRQDSS